jgi:hypothetical protein
MTISTDKIVDGFPHPNIAPIGGIPTYESIAELNLQLNANTASVQSNLGDGQLGLLALTVSPAVFNTLSAVAFVHPVNPGTKSRHPSWSHHTCDVTSHSCFCHPEGNFQRIPRDQQRAQAASDRMC